MNSEKLINYLTYAYEYYDELRLLMDAERNIEYYNQHYGKMKFIKLLLQMINHDKFEVETEPEPMEVEQRERE